MLVNFPSSLFLSQPKVGTTYRTLGMAGGAAFGTSMATGMLFLIRSSTFEAVSTGICSLNRVVAVIV